METTRVTKTETIRKLFNAHPSWTAKQIARKAKADVSLAYQVRKLDSQEKPTTDSVVAEPLARQGITMDMLKSMTHRVSQGTSRNRVTDANALVRSKLSDVHYEGYLLGNLFKHTGNIGSSKCDKEDLVMINLYTNALESFLASKS
jgi:hypothetical protein